jgi:hypothetical protein
MTLGRLKCLQMSHYHLSLALLKLKLKWKNNKSPGTDHNPAELVQAGGRTWHSEIHKRIRSTSNKTCRNSERNLFLYAFIIDYSNYGEYHSFQLQPNTVFLIKSRRVRWKACSIGEMISAYNIFIGERKGKRPRVGSRRKWIILNGRAVE